MQSFRRMSTLIDERGICLEMDQGTHPEITHSYHFQDESCGIAEVVRPSLAIRINKSPKAVMMEPSRTR